MDESGVNATNKQIIPQKWVQILVITCKNFLKYIGKKSGTYLVQERRRGDKSRDFAPTQIRLSQLPTVIKKYWQNKSGNKLNIWNVWTTYIILVF